MLLLLLLLSVNFFVWSYSGFLVFYLILLFFSLNAYYFLMRAMKDVNLGGWSIREDLGRVGEGASSSEYIA